MNRLILAAAALAGAASLQAQKPAADLIVTNARIYTVDDAHPLASALTVREGRIQFVGSEREALALRGPATQMVDAKGQTIVPGIVDAHAHLLGRGCTLSDVQLFDTRSFDQVVQKGVARLNGAPAGRWIRGRGWDQNKWGDTRFPTHEPLSKVSPNNPIVLTRVDGHAILVNAVAMKAAGVTAATQDPSGGRIERFPNGEPTGVFIDNAKALVERFVPAPTKADIREATLAAIKESQKYGLVGVHDAGEPQNVIDVFEEMAKAGEFGLRNYVMVGDDSAAVARYFARGPQSALYDGRIWIRPPQLYSDRAPR